VTTKYRLVKAPQHGHFNSAVAAVAFAFLNEINPDWEPVDV
jgi:hypothetical protein